MAERSDERERANWRDEPGYRNREYSERDRTDRSADEARSWFGDDESAQRRRMDEMREGRDRDRNLGSKGGSAVGRTWERAREATRDLTDRDHDGRRGFAEWNDNDQTSDRPWLSGNTPNYNRNRDDWGRDRQHTGTAAYDPYVGSRGNTAPATSGEHAGRGPRGYQRGDQRILEDVCDRLTDDPRIDASDIEVQVKDGEVTLAGSVRSRDEKRFTEDLIERVSGVRDVNNHLKVKAADTVLGTARSGSSVLGLTDTPPPAPTKAK